MEASKKIKDKNYLLDISYHAMNRFTSAIHFAIQHNLSSYDQMFGSVPAVRVLPAIHGNNLRIKYLITTQLFLLKEQRSNYKGMLFLSIIFSVNKNINFVNQKSS